MAGTFESEGTVGIYRQHTSFNLMVRVSNTQRDMIHPFLIFGGVIQTRRKERLKPLFQWRLSSNQALLFLQVIEPYLVSERMKLRVSHAIHFQLSRKHPKKCDLADYRRVQKDFYFRMLELNK